MSEMRTSELRIETPEGVTFSFLLASPISRWFAWLLDALIVLAAAQALSQLTSVLGVLSQDWARALGVLGYFVLSVAYSMTLEWRWRGQTIGKRLFGLRVVDAQGLRLSFSQVALRNLLRAVDQLPLCYLVGGATALLSAKSQRLGDLAANTIVLREPETKSPSLDQIAPSRYNSLAEYPHLAARLRANATAEAASIAMRGLLQRDTYAADARLTLFAELAAHFKQLVTFPEEATAGLTDEQYVRSVIRVLFAQKG